MAAHKPFCRILCGSLAVVATYATIGGGLSDTAWAGGARSGALASTTTTAPAASGSSSTASAPASAPLCSAATLARARQVVETALSDRVTQLNRLVGRVDGAARLAASDRSTLLAMLNQTELPGIEALASKVPGETTCAGLLQDARTMVFDYRVYLLMTPQTNLVIASDAAADVSTTMSSFDPIITRRVNQAKTQGKDVSGAETAFADYQAQIAAAEQLVAGQSARLLALTPAGYPGNASVLRQARQNLESARTDLHAARADLDTIRQSLS